MVRQAREVRGTKQVDHCLNRTGLIPVLPQIALQGRLSIGGPQQGRQVSAGGGSQDTNPLGIEAKTRRLGPQPANSRLALVNLGRE